MRIVTDDLLVDANTMMITAGIGVVFNLVMGAVLHFGKTGHSHFGMSHSHGSHGHSHGHSHGSHDEHHNHNNNNNNESEEDVEEGVSCFGGEKSWEFFK
jgi:zinc transporter 2